MSYLNGTKKWQYALFITFVLGCVIFSFINFSYAADNDLPKTGSFLDKTIQSSGLFQGTYSESMSLSWIIADIIETILGFLGVIFVILIIYAGFLWMTAGGNEEKIKKAKGLITNATIGLLIVLAAYTITHFVIKYIFEATGGGGDGGGGIDYTD